MCNWIRLSCILTLLLVSPSLLVSQPISDQEWHLGIGLVSDTLTVSCSEFVLPIDTGSLLSEIDPINSRSGEMSQSMSSSHTIKATLQPQSGTSDTLATLNGGSIDGCSVLISTQDVGDTITITDSGNIDTPGGNVVLNSPDITVELVQRGSLWIVKGAIASGAVGGGPGSTTAACETDPVLFTRGGDDSLGLCVSTTEQPTLQTLCNGGTCSYFFDIPAGQIMRFSYQGVAGMEIDDAFNTTLLNNGKRGKAPWIGAGAWESDGVQCLEWAPTVFNGAPARPAILCASNNASTISTSAVLPSNWDAGTFEARPWVIATGGTPSGTYHLDWAIQCRGSGEVADNTWGTEQSTVWDFDAGGDCGGSACPQWTELRKVSAAITAAGGCEKNDRISIRGQINQGATTATNVYFLGTSLGFVTDDVSD